jgi:putative transcriptional regulator
MNERNIGNEILEGLQEIKRFKRGEIDLKTHSLLNPPTPREIRQRLKLSQREFAGLMGVGVQTVRDWEQGRRNPRGPAAELLRIAEQHPEIFVQTETTTAV